MSTNKSQDAGAQARRPRRKRTREEREKRDAAFAKPRRGRPAGTSLSFFNDPDRFSVALIYYGEVFIRLPRYSAAYVVSALISKRPIDARSARGVLLYLNGGPSHSTLKSAVQRLIDKCDRPHSTDEAEWIKLSAAHLGMFLKLASDRSPDPAQSSAVVVALYALGWTATLKTITAKVSAIAGSNLPPGDEAVSRRVNAFAEGLRSRSKK